VFVGLGELAIGAVTVGLCRDTATGDTERIWGVGIRDRVCSKLLDPDVDVTSLGNEVKVTS